MPVANGDYIPSMDGWGPDRSPDLGASSKEYHERHTSPLDLDLSYAYDDFGILPPSPPASSSPSRKTDTLSEAVRKDAAAKARSINEIPRAPFVDTFETLRKKQDSSCATQNSQARDASSSSKRKTPPSTKGSANTPTAGPSSKRAKTKSKEKTSEPQTRAPAINDEEIINSFEEIPSCSETLRNMQRSRKGAESALDGILVHAYSMVIHAEQLAEAKREQSKATDTAHVTTFSGGLDADGWLAEARRIKDRLSDAVLVIQGAQAPLNQAMARETRLVAGLYVDRLQRLKNAQNQEREAERKRDSELQRELERLREVEKEREAKRQRVVDLEAKRVREVERQREVPDLVRDQRSDSETLAESLRQIGEWKAAILSRSKV